MNMHTKAGKSFYAALSLSVAMVGAACWYAYSSAGRTEKPQVQQTTPAITTTSSISTGSTTLTTARQTTTTMQTAPQEVEQAAAVVRPGTTQTTATTVITAATAPLPLQPILPIEGEVLQGYSEGELVKSATTGIWQTHNGIDFAAAIGDDVRCVMDGTVLAIERDALWGVRVTLLHGDGTVTRYCGLAEGLNIEAGQLISRGTVLGTVGDTCEAEAALPSHLHFEVLRNDAFMNPQAYLTPDV